ncbi:hypothetical protein Q3G72_021482 [Acer saccharum]|nr:hypothetical protein Q3G72_021482 [Acer saccharum]
MLCGQQLWTFKIGNHMDLPPNFITDSDVFLIVVEINKNKVCGIRELGPEFEEMIRLWRTDGAGTYKELLKPLMMFGTDGASTLASPSNQLADMDRFVGDGSLDDNVDRGMDVSQGVQNANDL